MLIFALLQHIPYIGLNFYTNKRISFPDNSLIARYGILV